MEKRNERINTLLMNKKPNQGVSIEAGQLIYAGYCEDKNSEILANYLHLFHKNVVVNFCAQSYFELSRDEQDQLIGNFISHPKFTENSGGGSLNRGFAILTVLVKNNARADNSVKLMAALSLLAGKKKVFTPTSVKHLLEFLNECGELFLDLDFAALNDDENRKIFQYLCAAIPDVSAVPYGPKIVKWAERYHFSWPKQISKPQKRLPGQAAGVGEALPAPDSEKTAEYQDDGSMAILTGLVKTEELIRRLKTANEEAEKLFNHIFSKNQTIENLLEQLNQKNDDISRLKAEVLAKNEALHQRQQQLDDGKAHLVAAESEISQLQQKLKEIYALDQAAKQQELMTLKNDLKMAVKLQYEDFIEHRDSICTEDNYEAVKANLNQVFRTLKRYGVEL